MSPERRREGGGSSEDVPAGRRRSWCSNRAIRSSFSKACDAKDEARSRSHGNQEIQADLPRRPVHDGPYERGAHQKEAGEEPRGEQGKPGRAEQPGQNHHLASWGWAQEKIPDDRLPEKQEGHPGQGRRDRIRSEPVGPHRPSSLRGRGETVHSVSGRALRGRHGSFRKRRGHQTGQRTSDTADPGGDDGPQRGAQDRQGRADGPCGGKRRPDSREGRAVRPLAPRFGRGKARLGRLHGYGGAGGKPGPREGVAREGRQEPLARPAADGSGRRHEPGGPPARRRGGEILRGEASLHALWETDQGAQDPEEQDFRSLHRKTPEINAKGSHPWRDRLKRDHTWSKAWRERSAGRWNRTTRRSSRPGPGVPPSRRTWWASRSPSTTGGNSCPSSSRKTWSGTNSGSFRRPARFTAIRATGRPR